MGMDIRVRFSTIVLATCLLGGIMVQPAHAYVDPGTGSYVLQLLVAGLLGGLLAAKVFWSRTIAYLKGLVSRRRKEDKAGIS